MTDGFHPQSSRGRRSTLTLIQRSSLSDHQGHPITSTSMEYRSNAKRRHPPSAEFEPKGGSRCVCAFLGLARKRTHLRIGASYPSPFSIFKRELHIDEGILGIFFDFKRRWQSLGRSLRSQSTRHRSSMPYCLIGHLLVNDAQKPPFSEGGLFGAPKEFESIDQDRSPFIQNGRRRRIR